MATQVLILAFSIAIVVAPLAVIGGSIDALDSAERRLFAQAWSLRNLVPAEARGAARDQLASPEATECAQCPVSEVLGGLKDS